MKKIILTSFAAAMIAAGCSTDQPASNNAVDHSKMDHSQMDHSTMDHSDHSAMQSSPGAADAHIDLQFIDTMIAHHQGAVDMAKMAVLQGEDQQLKKFNEGVVESQEREITQMKRWRDEWFKDAKPAINMDFPGMHEGMKDMDMKKLGALNGKAFDIEYVKQMIPHHEGALTMSKELNAKTERSELKQLGDAIIKAQTEEIEQMKKWLEEWEKDN